MAEDKTKDKQDTVIVELQAGKDNISKRLTFSRYKRIVLVNIRQLRV